VLFSYSGWMLAPAKPTNSMEIPLLAVCDYLFNTFTAAGSCLFCSVPKYTQCCQHFRVTCLHLKRKHYVPLKCWYLPTSLHIIATKNMNINIFTTLRTSNLNPWLVHQSYFLCIFLSALSLKHHLDFANQR
jgi:hypothetical protein